MLTSFDEAVGVIGSARRRADLGDDPAKAYRELAKLVHPDIAPPGRTAEAHEAFTRLNALVAKRTVTITTKNGTYEAGEMLGHDGLADYFTATTAGSEVVLKIARRPSDNDLMRHEAAHLSTVAGATAAEFKAYLPTLQASFPYRETGTGAERLVHVFPYAPNFFTLDTVIKAFPSGLEARHVAWIWRRLLVVVGLAHRAGIVHGAVVPEHILIEPEQHGLVLANWCYSVPVGQRVPAIVKRWRANYPDGILNRQPAGSHHDVSMLSRIVLAMLEPGAPASLRQFANMCISGTPRSAWHLMGELDKELANVYGPRKFTPFPMMPMGVLSWPNT